MSTEVTVPAPAGEKRGPRWTHVLLIVLATIVVTVGVTYWVLATWVLSTDNTKNTMDMANAVPPR